MIAKSCTGRKHLRIVIHVFPHLVLPADNNQSELLNQKQQSERGAASSRRQYLIAANTFYLI